MGTPVSMSASVEAQTEAIEVEPFDDNTSETNLMVYGNSSSGGMTGTKALSARAPCPTSLLEAPRKKRVSPVENGGKL